MVQQQDLIEKHKMTISIYVIDKKKDKPANVNLPKAAIEAMPKTFRMRKSYFIKAKVGPQITTLMCDKKVFEAIHAKKTFKVDIAGIYIVSIKTTKTDKTVRNVTAEPKKRGFLDTMKASFNDLRRNRQ